MGADLKKRILVGVTGASGSLYASRLIEELSTRAEMVYLVLTENGRAVAEHELDPKSKSVLLQILKDPKKAPSDHNMRLFDCRDLFAPIASGTNTVDAMVIVPCSMGTMARIAQGISGNLLERSADVVLKQRRQLVICPRESPFNRIHLKNMLELSDAGAEVLPLMPGFYHKPKSMEDLVDFCVGRILDQLGFDHDLYKPWNNRRMR
jgi:flavin prenyltransferase